MGLTVGAGGTSAPDALVSFHVARNGVGDMAVSNALGSNVFDILLCLGLPWVIKTISTGKAVPVSTDDFKTTFIIMIGVLLIFTTNLIISYCRHGRIVLSNRLGYMYLFLYLCFVIFSVLYCETDIFGTQDKD
jgi:Ca2+/Na+ antiporter